MKVAMTMAFALLCGAGALAQTESKPSSSDSSKSDKGARLPFKLQKGQKFTYTVDMSGGAMGSGSSSETGRPSDTSTGTGKEKEKDTSGVGSSAGASSMHNPITYRVNVLDSTGATTTLSVAVDMHGGMGSKTGSSSTGSSGSATSGSGSTSSSGTGSSATSGTGAMGNEGEQTFTVKCDSNGRITEILGPGQASMYDKSRAVETGRSGATPMAGVLPVGQIGPHIALILGSGLHETTLEPGRIYFENNTAKLDTNPTSSSSETSGTSGTTGTTGTSSTSPMDRERSISSMYGQQVDLASLRMRVEGQGSQEGQDVVRLSIVKSGSGMSSTSGSTSETGRPNTETAGTAGGDRTLGQAYYRVSDGLLQSCTIDLSAGSSAAAGSSSTGTSGTSSTSGSTGSTGASTSVLGGHRITIRRVSDSDVPRND